MIEKPDIPGSAVSQVRVSTAARGIAPGLPPALAALRPETLLQALVLGTDRQGHTLLRTSFGDLSVTTRLSLPEGSQIMLKILNNIGYVSSPGAVSAPSPSQSREFQARILTINGKPPDTVLLPPPQAAGILPSVQTTIPAGFDIIHAIPLTSGGQGAVQISTSSHSAASGMASSPAAQEPAEAAVIALSKGMQVDVRVLEVAPDSARFLPATGVPYTPPGLAAMPLSAALAPLPSHTKAPQPASVDTVRVHILAIQFSAKPDTQPVAVSTTILAPQVPAVTNNLPFSGAVIGVESGETVLKTQIGILKLPMEVSLPKGAQLLFEVVSLPHRATENIPLLSRETDIAGRIANVTGVDSGLHQLASLLRLIDVEANTRYREEQFPQLDKFLAARALWFMQGVQQGSAERWLHPHIRHALEQYEKHDIIAKLGSDFASLRQLFSEPTPGGWNMMFFPLLDGSQLRYATLYTKHHRKKEEREREKPEGNRFLVEVTLESFGEMQLDGLFRKQEKQGVLELFVRSSQSLAEEMQQDITAIFARHLENAGLTGWLAFQTTPVFPVNPMVPEGGEGEGSIIV